MTIRLCSLDGPDVYGPNRYLVRNPGLGLTGETLYLDGRKVRCHHVSHNNHDRDARTFVIVIRELNVRRMRCRDVPTRPVLELLYEIYKRDSSMSAYESHDDASLSLTSVLGFVAPRLAAAKLRNLLRRNLIYRFTDSDVAAYQITPMGIAYLRNKEWEDD